MLGQFLELSVATQDIAGALAFYESLGFVQARVGEAWPHPYAVVTDGRITLGLHGNVEIEPTLTFVAPDVRSRRAELEALGVPIENARLDEISLNEVVFRAPGGQPVRLVEARTFSSPALDALHESALGYFEEYALGVEHPRSAGEFWERLGFVAFGDDGTKVVATSRALNIALHDADALAPTLVFTATDLESRVESLVAKGFSFARRVPRALGGAGATALQAPDGVQLLLVQAAA